MSSIPHALAGGALIGAAASLLLVWSGRIAGISGILGGVVSSDAGDRSWRVAFLAALVVTGGLLAWLRPSLFTGSPAGLGVTAAAGLLVGFGTRLGNGCTSGHGVCGVSRVSPRSLAATATFMAAGIATVATVRLLGGMP